MIYKLRTVDVWDTLLRRDCHPECIKLATAQHVFLGWSDHLKPNFPDCWSLYRARVNVERRLAGQAREQGKDDEYEITQVLNRWLIDIFSKPIESCLPSKFAEFELQTEMERSFVDPEIEAFLSLHKAERTVFLSDFYMGETSLRRLVCGKNLHHIVEEGISSCDVGLNKRSGRLFRHMHDVLGVSPEEHIHIGDNFWSDVESPQKIGINSIHFAPEIAHTERLERERLFSTREALFEKARADCLALAETSCKQMSPQQAAGYRLGADAAPMFIGFTLWIAEQAILNKLDQIFFLTREGEFFYQIYSALFRDRRLFGHELPPSRILAVSRLSTFTASMQDVSIKEMSRIWSLFKCQSIAGLFTTLRLNIEDFGELLASNNLNRCDVVNNPQSNVALKNLFRAPKFVDAVKRSVDNQRNVLLAYLEQSSLYPKQRIGLVDIGWRGTIQDNLALLMPQSSFYGMYLGLRRFVNIQPPNVAKVAYGPDENRDTNDSALFENFAVLEMICASANGSVIGYSRDCQEIIPQRQIVEEENQAFEQFTKYFQEGVLMSVEHWQPYLARYVVTASELRPYALHLWNTLRSAPGRDLAELFLQTPQHDVFGFGDIFRRNQVPSLNTILLAPISKSRRVRLIEFVRRVQWPEAIKHTHDIGLFHRRMLVLTFRLAHIMKRVRIKILMIWGIYDA